MTSIDPRPRIAQRAAIAARQQTEHIAAERQRAYAAAARQRASEARQLTKEPESSVRPRVGRLTQQAINALIRVRNEVSLGASRKDLLDRIDDELYGLRNKKAAAPKGSGLT